MSTSLDTLPTEIIHNILVYVIDTSPRTGKSLGLTNKCLFEAVKVIRSRRQTIRFDRARTTYEPEDFDSSAFAHTYHLTIEAPELSDPHLFNQTFIVQLLEKIRNLKTLSWNVGPISIDVLSVLERLHPRCELQVFKWWRLDGDLNHLDETEVALAKFKNLTHFRYVTISDPSSAATLSEMYSWEPFQEIVANSHSLKLASFLSSSIYRDNDAAEWVEECARKTKRNKLQRLTIDCPNLTLSSTTLQAIGEFTDLSALENLKFSRGRAQDYFQVAATLLPNLKHIFLNFNNAFNESMLKAAGEYLRTCSPVQTLSLWGWSPVIALPDLIARHGSSLQVLSLHERDVVGTRRTLGLPDMKLIIDSCPELTDITIDLAINAKYDIHTEGTTEIVEILRLVADRKPQLRRVQLYLSAAALHDTLTELDAENTNTAQIPTSSDSSFRQARPGRAEMFEYQKQHILSVVEPCATNIWKVLFGQCTSGERLLEVKFGDWETRSAMWGRQGIEPRIFCQIQPHERNDRVGQCVVRTRLWSRYDSRSIDLRSSDMRSRLE